MIKKIVLGFVACVSVFVGFSSAWSVLPVGSYSQSPYNSSYEINVINKGSFLSQYLGQTKDVLYYRLNDFFIWDQAGNLYTHLQRDPNNTNTLEIAEGYFNQYYVCDEITSSSTIPSNCSLGGSNIVNDSDVINVYKSFLKTVKSSDYYMVDDWTEYNYGTNPACRGLALCVSSSSIGKSICWGFTVQYGSMLCNKYSVQYFPGLGGLTGSVGLGDVSFGRLNGYPSPAVDGSINGGSNNGVYVNFTGNILYNTCTNGYVLNQLDSIWGRSLSLGCYAGSFNTGSLESGINYLGIVGTGLNFKELYKLTKNGQSFDNWFESNLDQIQRYKLGQVGVNPFLSSPVALYTYFDILWANGYTPNGVVSSYDLLNYCNLKLFSNYDEEYNGTYFKSYCDSLNYSDGGYIITGSVGDIDDEEILPPGFDEGGDNSVTESGTVISVDWSGTLSGETNKNFEGKTFINDVYQKLQANFKKPFNDVTGIIPGYILVALCGLILFRFLSH